MSVMVIGYSRVSTLGQVDGEGLGVQRERIQAWATYQGFEVERIEEDAGISGASMDRRGLKAVVSRALQLGAEAIVVVTKLDRLGRNALGVQQTLADLLAGNVRIVAINDGVDSGSGMGTSILKLLTSILSAFAELERETIRVRLQDGRRRADRADRSYASEPRYGRRAISGGRDLEPAPEEVALIARATELRQEGLSLRAIGSALLSEGHRPRRADTWAPAVVRRLVLGRREPVRPRTVAA